MLHNTAKEQLCTNASETLGWRRRPPPYVDHLDITVNYSHKSVAPPCLCPPLSLFMPDTIVHYNRLDPHAEEDRRLVLVADFPEDPNVLERLELDDWEQTSPFLDRSTRVRLFCGLGMPNMGNSR